MDHNAAVDWRIREARRLRDLGYYGQAIEYLDAVIHQPYAAIEAAAMALEQGLVHDCRQRLGLIEHSGGREFHDNHSYGLFSLLNAFVLALTTGKLTQPSQDAGNIFQQKLAWLASANYTTYANIDSKMIESILFYHGLCSLFKLVGFQHTLPTLPLPFFPLLFNCLVQAGRYDEARLIATMPNFSDAELDSQGMLEQLLSNPTVPSLTRAYSLLCKAEHMLASTQQHAPDTYRQILNESAALFMQVSHAYGPDVVRARLLEHGLCEGDLTQRTEELFTMKGRLEVRGSWTEAISCVKGIIKLNARGGLGADRSLQIRVEGSLQSIRNRCQNSIIWAAISILNYKLWLQGGGNMGAIFGGLKSLRNDIFEMEAPNLHSHVIQVLIESYNNLGDSEKAADLVSKHPYAVPPRMAAILGLDPFFARVKGETDSANVTTYLSECHSLGTDLGRVRCTIESSYDPEDKAVQVQRLCNLCNLYVQQGENHKRNIDDTENLLKQVLYIVDIYSQQLRWPASSIWAGHAGQIRARLQFLRSEYALMMEVKLQHLGAAVQLNEEVIKLYSAESHSYLAGTARQQLAVFHEKLWRIKEDNSGSEHSDFSKAITLYQEARELLEKYGNHAATTLNARLLLGLWMSGFLNGLNYVRVKESRLFGIRSVKSFSPVEEARRGLDELDDMAALDRNHLSALKDTKQAIIVRQTIGQANGSREVFEVAFRLYGELKELGTLWRWVQKSKARSTSDTLGLGINIPCFLKERLNQDAVARELLKQEETIVAKLDPNTPDTSSLIKWELNTHRQRMRSRPVLQELLDLREGQPVSIENLQWLKTAIPKADKKEIVFVDWVVTHQYYCLIILARGQVHNYTTNFRVEDSEAWKAHFAKKEDGRTRSRLDESDMTPFWALSRLVYPAIWLSEPGDLLVFSPTQDLFGMPLHAATVSENVKETVIERNPVVYTHSMTTLHQCVLRELKRRNQRPQLSRSFIAVFEETDEGRALSDQATKNVYGGILETLGITEKGLIHGKNIGKDRITNELGSTDVVSFIGHCDDHDNKLLQGIRLSPKAVAPGERIAGLAQPSPRFTALDVFSINVKTSTMLLLACGSAIGSLDNLDEPRGMTSALLCGGVSSVVGTMWNVHVPTAAIFAHLFHQNLSRASASQVIDLAIILQKSILELRTQYRNMTPYHWASFTLNGSWIMCR